MCTLNGIYCENEKKKVRGGVRVDVYEELNCFENSKKIGEGCQGIGVGLGSGCMWMKD